MIGMKDQCFGVEVEMTGLTRGQAAQALANYFGTEPYYVGGGYDKWSVKDPDGKVWSIMSDSSIVTEMKTESGYMHTSNIEYRVEMVTPKLTYAELCHCVDAGYAQDKKQEETNMTIDSAKDLQMKGS